jgi:hypothetical protein
MNVYNSRKPPEGTEGFMTMAEGDLPLPNWLVPPTIAEPAPAT